MAEHGWPTGVHRQYARRQRTAVHGDWSDAPWVHRRKCHGFSRCVASARCLWEWRFTGPFEEAGPSSDLASPTTFALNVMGRLQPGVDLKSAASQLPVLGKRVESAGPSDAAGKRELEIQYPSRLSLSTGP